MAWDIATPQGGPSPQHYAAAWQKAFPRSTTDLHLTQPSFCQPDIGCQSSSPVPPSLPPVPQKRNTDVRLIPWVE